MYMYVCVQSVAAACLGSNKRAVVVIDCAALVNGKHFSSVFVRAQVQRCILGDLQCMHLQAHITVLYTCFLLCMLVLPGNPILQLFAFLHELQENLFMQTSVQKHSCFNFNVRMCAYVCVCVCMRVCGRLVRGFFHATCMRFPEHLYDFHYFDPVAQLICDAVFFVVIDSGRVVLKTGDITSK